jgi:hypothetical protein
MESDTPQLSMFSVEDSPARTTQSQEQVRDWLEIVARSGGSITGSLLSLAPPGLSRKMSPGSSLVETALTLKRSSGLSANSGMAWPGRFLTLNTSEWRSDAVVSSLSDILEENPDPRFSLSPKACTGILHRAAKRDRDLPAPLLSALEAIAKSHTP